MSASHLQIITCGAGPAADVGALIGIAHAQGWTATISATASALAFIDVPALEELTRQPFPIAAHSGFAEHMPALWTEETMIAAGQPELRRIAERVADCFAESGYAFVEDDRIEELAASLASFLQAAGIPAHLPDTR